jgi:hypothetical protein
VNKKSQSFGFDVLVSVAALLIFNQLMFIHDVHGETAELLQHKIENSRALYLGLVYNNSISLYDSYVCSGNTESLARFRGNMEYFFETYAGNREYLLSASGEIISSESVDNVCLTAASPAVFEFESSCGTDLRFEFSIYTQGEKGEC